MSVLVVIALDKGEDEGEVALSLYDELRQRHDAEIHSSAPLDGVKPPPSTRPGRIARAAAIAATLAAALAVAVQHYTGQLAYPLDIGGRGVNWLAYSFVGVSLAMMWAAIAAVVAFVRMAGLPALRHRLFETSALEHIAANRVVIALDVQRAEVAGVRALLEGREGICQVEVVDDDA